MWLASGLVRATFKEELSLGLSRKVRKSGQSQCSLARGLPETRRGFQGSHKNLPSQGKFVDRSCWYPQSSPPARPTDA